MIQDLICVTSHDGFLKLHLMMVTSSVLDATIMSFYMMVASTDVQRHQNVGFQ